MNLNIQMIKHLQKIILIVNIIQFFISNLISSIFLDVNEIKSSVKSEVEGYFY